MSESAVLENPPEAKDKYQTLVASLEKPMLKICNELKSGLERNKYGIIVGDDTSGRLPTLALKGFSDFVSDQNHMERLPTVFLQSGTKAKDEDVALQFKERVLSRKKDIQDKKALIVTDYIQSGRSVNRLMELFKSQDLPFDVVVLHLSDEFDQSKLVIPESSNMIIGEVSPYSPSVWAKETLTGLSRIEIPTNEVRAIRGTPFYNKRLRQAREDINLLVRKLSEQIYPDQ